MASIFELEPADLGRLDDKRSTNLFQKLLLGEAEKTKIPKTKIHISISTNIPDGGIDAEIDYKKTPKEGLLINGKSGYQLKSGTTFKPWTKTSLHKELFGSARAKISKSNLKTGIKACLDEGRYVIVTFGHQIDSTRHRDAISLLKKYLKKCGYKKPRIEVLGQNHIVNYLNSYPSLVLDLKGFGSHT